MAAIGIDLGTTNCCVSVVKNGKPVIIIDGSNKRITPSYISFVDGEILSGHIAQARAFRKPENTIYDVKRMIGRNFSDEAVQSDKIRWKFTVTNHEGKLKVRIKSHDDQFIFYTPEELSAILLKKLKQNAEENLQTEVTKAVITVPAYFMDSQRQATIDAGRIAGFEEVRLLNEPTAAALAYAIEYGTEIARNILIFDLGGGTFDVSIVKSKNNEIEVLSVDGDLHLGGGDIDNILIDYFSKDIIKQFGVDVTKDIRKFFRLKENCINIKEELSFSVTSEAELDSVCGDDDYLAKLNRAMLEDLTVDLFTKMMTTVDNCLNKAKLKKIDIDDIILIGGSTKIVKLHNLIFDYFQKDAKKNINPDEAVAMGAAIQAARWMNDPDVQNIKFSDITPWSLGVQTRGGIMNVVIPKNSKIPAHKTKIYSTTRDDQNSIIVRVYYGENELTKDNTYLGELKVIGIRPTTGRVQIYETFTVNENGILTVTAIDRTSGKEYNLTLSLDNKGKLTEEDIICKQSEVEESFSHHEKIQQYKKLKNDVDSLCKHLSQIDIQDSEILRLYELCTDSLTKSDVLNAYILERHYYELKQKCNV